MLPVRLDSIGARPTNEFAGRIAEAPSAAGMEILTPPDGNVKGLARDSEKSPAGLPVGTIKQPVSLTHPSSVTLHSSALRVILRLGN